MTAELWLHKPCEHGDDWLTCDTEDCPGGSRVRLDPEQVVMRSPWDDENNLTVGDIIDALEEE